MRARTRRRLLAGGAVAAVVAVIVVVIVLVTGESASPVPRPAAAALAASNVTALAWDLPALDDSARVTHAQFVGRPTVVHFFASGCPVCDEELPLFRSAVSSYGDRVHFVFVDTADPGDWRTVVADQHLAGLALAADVAPDRQAVGDGLYRAVGGTGTLPFTAFYDADGSLVQATDHPLVGGALRQAIQQLYGIGA